VELLRKYKGGFSLILFTSDLDRTLIYSDKMMKTHPVDNEIVPVEYKGEEAITFMTQTSIELLKKFNQENLFVPVTTRALYQYERIHLFQEEIKPKFAIVNNGGTILIDGQVDTEWDKLIRRRLEVTSVPMEDMLRAFAKIRHDQWVEKEFQVDTFFYMFHVNTANIPHAELADFEVELQQLGWRMFLHGRKLYILPHNLNKAFAVSRLQSYVEYEVHVAAGDSLMDYDMILLAEHGFSPTHGELYDVKRNDSRVKWLNRKGAGSAEELLQNLLELKTTIIR
jgi:hydroxymethylpyrimidine pyrophosphatase-like HAD family hydrolase